MKKWFALALCALMVLSLVACGAPKPETDPTEPEEEAETVSEPLSGGWMHAESPDVTDDLRAVFEKALDGLVGVDYVPVAYLGSQVVSGTNHCFLCQAKPVYPDAQPSYVLVYIYEDFDGGATLMNIADFDIGALCEYGAVSDEPADVGGCPDL